eukprot:ANDGO_02123.mRNA.1 hypothetical protein
MPEVHVVGEISSGSHFEDSLLFCKWRVVCGPQWRKVSGADSGSTHVVQALEEEHVFSHPIDIHFAAKAIEGWPRLLIRVWKQDMFGRNDFCGYALCHIPTSPGSFVLECPCWRPQGTLMEEMTAWFLGGRPQLRHEDLVLSGDNRFRLRTVSMGVVRVRLSVITKDFAKHGVVFG